MQGGKRDPGIHPLSVIPAGAQGAGTQAGRA